MTDRQRQWPSRQDIRSGRTLPLNGAPEPEEPSTRRIPGPAVAKQRIILLARDMRSRLSSSAVARVLGQSTLRGMSDASDANNINETLARLSAAKEGREPEAQVIDYGGVDPFKAEVARALGRTEVCYGVPPEAVPAFAEVLPPANPSAHASEHDEVSPFAETSRSLPPPAELRQRRDPHEQSAHSLVETGTDHEIEVELNKRQRGKLVLSVVALLGLGVAGNWPLATEPVRGTLTSYSGVHELTSALAGQVTQVFVTAGEHVTIGQPVLQLDEVDRASAASPAHQHDVSPVLSAEGQQEVVKLEQALHASAARTEAQRGLLSNLESKRDRLMEFATHEYVSPIKLSAVDDQVDLARGQLRALEAEQLHARQALEAKLPRLPADEHKEQRVPSQVPVKATHAGIVARVFARPGATIATASPLLHMLDDAAVPALIITCSEQDAQRLLDSPEVRLTVQGTQLSALVTRLVEHAPGAEPVTDERRAVELALNDSGQLAALAQRAEAGTPISIEPPQRRTLFSQAGRWLQHEFQ